MLQSNAMILSDAMADDLAPGVTNFNVQSFTFRLQVAFSKTLQTAI